DGRPWLRFRRFRVPARRPCRDGGTASPAADTRAIALAGLVVFAHHCSASATVVPSNPREGNGSTAPRRRNAFHLKLLCATQLHQEMRLPSHGAGKVTLSGA